MRTIETTFNTFGASVLLLGYKGDSQATQILIDCAEALEDYQGTMAALSITAPDETVYPGDITLDEDGVVHWVLSARDCGIAGHGSARIDLVDDEETVVASAEATTMIIKTNMQGVAPDQIREWTEAASVALQEVRLALLDLYEGDNSATTNEAARQLAETGRVNAENARVTAENARVTAENARVTAESLRAQAEGERETAETARETAEAARETAEEEREDGYSTIEENAQAALSYIGPSEASSTASAAHAQGSYLIYDGKLYQATANIAIGDTLATTGAGANIAQVTGGAMGEVDNLKSALDAAYEVLLIPGKNKLDPAAILPHHVIGANGDPESSDTSSSVSGLINTENATSVVQVYRNSLGNDSLTNCVFAFYGPNGYMSQTTDNPASIPDGTTHLRAQIPADYSSATDRVMVAFANVLTPYEPFQLKFNPDNVESLEGEVGTLETKAESLESEVFGDYTPGKNKLDPNNVTGEKTINAETGEIEDTTAHTRLTAIIPVGSIKHVIISYVNSQSIQNVINDSNMLTACYDTDGVFIPPLLTGGNNALPVNCTAIRCVISPAYRTVLDKIMIEFGETMTTFEPYAIARAGGLADQVDDVTNRVAAIEAQTIDRLISGVFNGSIKQIKLIGDSITQGVGGTGFNPLNSSASTYFTDVAAEIEAGTWSEDAETVNTYFGDGEVTCRRTSSQGMVYFRVNTEGVCWGKYLNEYLHDKYGVTVKNYGTRGLASYHMFLAGYTDNNNIFHSLIEQLIEPEDDAVIIMFGTNDRVDDKNVGAGSITTYISYTQQIIDYVQSLGKIAVIMANLPASEAAESASGVDFHMDDVASAVSYMAGKNHIESVNIYNEVVKYLLTKDNVTLGDLLSDTLHPNDSGYELMYKIILDSLRFGMPLF